MTVSGRRTHRKGGAYGFGHAAIFRRICAQYAQTRMMGSVLSEREKVCSSVNSRKLRIVYL
jgi:hypothetical protein